MDERSENNWYVFTYKCRYCNEVFSDSCTGKKLATKFIVQTICNLKKDPQHPGELSAHYAVDHIGIADLIGCKIEKDNN